MTEAPMTPITAIAQRDLVSRVLVASGWTTILAHPEQGTRRHNFHPAAIPSVTIGQLMSGLLTGGW
jgi:hypothetical protein